MENEKRYLIYAPNDFYKICNTLEKATEEAYNYSHTNSGSCGVIELPEPQTDANGERFYNLCMMSDKLAQNENTFVFVTPFSTKETYKETNTSSVSQNIIFFAPKIFNA